MKEMKLRVGVLLENSDEVALGEFENLLKWVAQSNMKIVHISGIKQELMLEFTEFLIERLKKSMVKS